MFRYLAPIGIPHRRRVMISVSVIPTPRVFSKVFLNRLRSHFTYNCSLPLVKYNGFPWPPRCRKFSQSIHQMYAFSHSSSIPFEPQIVHCSQLQRNCHHPQVKEKVCAHPPQTSQLIPPKPQKICRCSAEPRGDKFRVFPEELLKSSLSPPPTPFSFLPPRPDFLKIQTLLLLNVCGCVNTFGFGIVVSISRKNPIF